MVKLNQNKVQQALNRLRAGMKKDDQIINLISILKRLHRQQDSGHKKITSPFSKSTKQSAAAKPLPIEQAFKINRQSQQISPSTNDPAQSLLMSSRNHPSYCKDPHTFAKSTLSQLPTRFHTGPAQPTLHNQTPTGKSTSPPNVIHLKPGLLRGIKKTTSSESETKQHKTPPACKLTFEADSSRFLWISPPKTKAEQSHSLSAAGKLKTKKQLSLPYRCSDGRKKKMNKYSQYCQEIYEKYSSRVQKSQEKNNEHQQGEWLGEQRNACTSTISCSLHAFNSGQGRNGLAQIAKLRKFAKREGTEAKQRRMIRIIDLKAIKQIGFNNLLHLTEEGAESPISDQDENELQFRPQGLSKQHQIDAAQVCEPCFESAPDAKPVGSGCKTPVKKAKERKCYNKYKYKGVSSEVPKFHTEQVAQLYEDCEIKIEGWQMSSNPKNVVSRSGSIFPEMIQENYQK